MSLRGLLALSSLACLLAPPAHAVDGAWVHVDRFRFPQGRQDHVAAYDSKRDHFVVFGGFDNNGSKYLGDVWTLDRGTYPNWSELSSGIGGPGGRRNAAGIYDPVRDRLVVMGGWNGSGTRNDVWVFPLDGSGGWSQLFPSGTPPPPRFGHSAIYDPVRDRFVIFGGNDGTYYEGDVWALNLSGAPSWTQLTPQGRTPISRYGHAAVYDSRNDRMLMFGGVGGQAFVGSPNYWFNDTWALPLGSSAPWESLTVAGQLPGARAFQAASYDSSGDQLLMTLGERPPYYQFAGDTLWKLSLSGGRAWSSVVPTAPSGWFPCCPAVVSGAGDRAGNLIVFAGNYPGRLYTNQLDPAGHRTDLTPQVPIPDPNEAVVFDQFNHSLVSSTDCGNHISWRLLFEPVPHWLPLQTIEVTRGMCVNGWSAIYDPGAKQIVVYTRGGIADPAFGGIGSNSVSWQWRSVTGTVPFPGSHASVIVPQENSLYSYDASKIQVFRLDLASLSWAQLTLSGTYPPTRYGTPVTYDPIRHRLLAFGGLLDSDGSYLNETYSIQLGPSPSWNPLVTSGAPPPPRADALNFYDPKRDRMLVFGGRSGPDPLGDIWELSLSGTPTWRHLDIQGPSPPLRSSPHVVFDLDRDRLILYGGRNGDVRLEDVWVLAFDTSTPTGVSTVQAQALPGRVEITWWIPQGPGTSVQVERKTEYGEWSPLTTLVSDMSSRIELEDWDVVAGQRYGYRVIVGGETGGLVWLSVPSSPRPSLALQGPGSNPVSGPFTLGFSLPSQAHADLELIDARGRLVWSKEVGSMGAGFHQVPVEATLSPGVYVARLRQEGAMAKAKFIAIR